MKNVFLKSTFILIIGTFLTKVIGLLIKVITTRTLGLEGISLLSLINPTYSLLLSLANFNIMLACSKRISSNNRAKKVLVNSCYIMFCLNVMVILFMLFFTKYLSLNLLKNSNTYYPLISITITLPFISLGYIIKGYFYGKQNVLPHMISNVLEQLVRLFLISLILPKLVKYGPILTVTVLILLNVITESLSIIILLCFIPKKATIKRDDLKLELSESKEILSISIPSVSGRLLCNIGFFFEPILLTKVLLYTNNSLSYITQEYGIYNTYVIGTLLFPTFIISAISNALLPEISKYHSLKKYDLVKKRIKQSLSLSLLIGLICTIFIYFFSPSILRLLYNTTDGLTYIKFLSFFFLLFYLESPLASILTGLNRIKTCTFISVSGVIIKLLVMIILGLLNFKIYALIISEIVNIIYVTIFELYIVKKELA